MRVPVLLGLLAMAACGPALGQKRAIDSVSFENSDIITYRNGVKHGYYINTDPSSEGWPIAMGRYCEGVPCGIWYFFETGGRIFLVEEILSPARNRKHIDCRTGKPFLFTSKIREYHGGILRGEGEIVFDEQIDQGFWRVGSWTYYLEGRRSRHTYLKPIMGHYTKGDILPNPTSGGCWSE